MSPFEAGYLPALLSAPVFMDPRLDRDRIFFASDLGGRMSLYSIPLEGGDPKPLLPEGLALQNPSQMYGTNLFVIQPEADRILLALDQHGDERYQPHWIPRDGGTPTPLFPHRSPADSLMLLDLLPETGTAYFRAERQGVADFEILAVELATLEVESLAAGPSLTPWICVGPKRSFEITCDQYTFSDQVLSLWDRSTRSRIPLVGVPMEKRNSGQLAHKPFAFDKPIALGEDGPLILRSIAYSDLYSPCLLDLRGGMRDVRILGLSHEGSGELRRICRVSHREFFLEYNIDGCSHGYIGELDVESAVIRVTVKICGDGQLGDERLEDRRLANGVLQGIDFASHEEDTCRAVLSHSSATRPSSLFRLDRGRESEPVVLVSGTDSGVPTEVLSPGEDASFTSFDGLRISARLYLPSPALQYSGKRPVILYIHGGRQSQERPDFTWFSMPLIQHLTLSGFAVFVPNIRGSTGYGVEYMRKVQKDWGGEDQKDLVFGLQSLEGDSRIDSRRRGAVGRSYGGFMTTNLLARYPGLLGAGVNLFGMCSLIDCLENAPEAAREYLRREVGDLSNEGERRKMTQNSATTHFDQIQAPLLFIQGTNDPRALPELSLGYYETLRKMGKEVELLLFEDEGHDIIKRENRVVGFRRIAEFFARYLQA
jgi:dienelactone hydrolase